jgi:hypothetical protein
MRICAGWIVLGRSKVPQLERHRVLDDTVGSRPGLNARTAGVYLRPDPSDLEVLDGGSGEERGELIAQRLREWRSAANTF